MNEEISNAIHRCPRGDGVHRHQSRFAPNVRIAPGPTVSRTHKHPPLVTFIQPLRTTPDLKFFRPCHVQSEDLAPLKVQELLLHAASPCFLPQIHPQNARKTAFQRRQGNAALVPVVWVRHRRHNPDSGNKFCGGASGSVSPSHRVAFLPALPSTGVCRCKLSGAMFSTRPVFPVFMALSDKHSFTKFSEREPQAIFHNAGSKKKALA